MSHLFACSGVASRSLYSTAEAFWRSDLEAEELVEVFSSRRTFVSTLKRDCMVSSGAVVYLINGWKEEECGNWD